ncbi:Polyadenylate-binding protein 3-like [Heracleum sosnowskyi]|uniref:Polyadenylate-binding protein 3-like n=1 Tax=Heracleum sosnowskyi TaxID=360622 RepID=A0AAD8JDQ4_9APIA|nr:Polyadenylate-binding protein 3-like [Heracleum sosnowskyi]
MINKYTVSDEEFRNMFEKFGLITSAVVMKDADGKSRCFGFVNFQNFDNAAAAVENMNGVSCNEKVLYVGKAQRKSEREAELRAKFEQERISRFEKLKGANLYLKNLDDTINEETPKDLFSKFGTITSCKVNLDPQGISKGSGFVAFSNPDDAAVAMNEMNGTMVGKKPLYVVVAHRKDERRAHLQVELLSSFCGLYLAAIGTGGLKAAAPSLGADQFDEEDPEEAASLSVYFNWLFFSIVTGAIFGVITFLVWVNTFQGWNWGFLVSTLAVLVAVLCLYTGKSLYRQQVPEGSPLAQILQ